MCNVYTFSVVSIQGNESSQKWVIIWRLMFCTNDPWHFGIAIRIGSSAVARVDRSYRLFWKASVRLPVAKKSDYSAIHAMVTLLYQTLQSTLKCGNLVHAGDGCRQEFCIKNCGQTAADRDMITIRNLSSLYPTVPSATSKTYGSATIHALQTDDRRTEHRTISATVSIRLAKNGRGRSSRHSTLVH